MKHLKKIGYPIDYAALRTEAEELFDSMFNLRQFLSGRTLWVGGAENGVAEKYPLANFNCSFVNIKSWDDLGDLMYLLLVGTGVGFKTTKAFAAGLAPIRVNTKLEHAEYKPVPKHQRLESTRLEILDNGYAKIFVGDSKEGWVEALRIYLRILTETRYESVHTVKISYNSIRPKGERLLTFGGTASGHESLKEMFEGFDKVLKNLIDPTLEPMQKSPNPRHTYMSEELGLNVDYRQVRPIHIVDMANLVGNNVVVGGVRRTAEIALFDADDYECILAKYGINGIWKEEHFKRHEDIKRRMVELDIPIPAWFDEVGTRHYDPNVNGDKPFNYGRPLHHRRMSNNSIAFETKPSREVLALVFTMMQAEGEPGFINLEEARRRRPNAEGLNPCAEILLDSYGVCNLTTVNLVAFVKNGKIDYTGLRKAQRLSARAGLRMTLATLELPHWDAVQQRDRLLGTSLTGVKDALAMIDANEHTERFILEELRFEAKSSAEQYAKKLRVNAPLLVTTVKPEGTLSQVAGGVSSGLHWSHSPYYIRRIRINAADPLAQAVIDLGWTVNPEVGTPGSTYEEPMQNARTYGIDFPIKSGAERTKDDVSAREQFETYFRFQGAYTDQNSSNTITVRNADEWKDSENIVWENWDTFTAVSFLSLDGGTYQLAPYEAITKEQYETLAANMTPFDPSILEQYEKGDDADLEGADSCESGACPIR